MGTSKKQKDVARGFAVPKAPVRTEVPEAEAARFVEGKAAKQKAAPATPPEPVDVSTTTVTRRATAKRRLERGERLTLYLPPELAAELRVYAARAGRSVSDAVTEAVRELLGVKTS